VKFRRFHNGKPVPEHALAVMLLVIDTVTRKRRVRFGSMLSKKYPQKKCESKFETKESK